MILCIAISIYVIASFVVGNKKCTLFIFKVVTRELIYNVRYNY